MARTIDRPIQLPRVMTGAGAEVVGTWQRGGMEYLARALNSTYEQLRRGPINDCHNASILNALGQLASYRCRAQGHGGLAGELVRMRYHVAAAGGGSMVVRAKQGASSTSWTYPGGTINTIVDGGTMTVDDTNPHFNIDVDISTLSGMSSSKVLAVYAYYERSRTSLIAVGAGDDAYDNGVVPLEISRYRSKCGFSTERIQDLHTLAIELLTSRTGQICASAYPISYLGSTDEVPYLLLQHPPFTTPMSSLKAIFWIKGTSDATKNVTFQVSAGFQDDGWTDHTLQIGTGAVAWYGPLEIEVSKYPSVTPMRVIVVAGIQIRSLCGWWDDLSY